MNPRVVCPMCQGRGDVVDPDPYADRAQWVCCRTCNGSKYIDPRTGRAWVAPTKPAPTPTPTPAAPSLPKGVRLIGKCSQTGKAYAAIVPRALAPEARAGVYRQLVTDARQQILLARRWDVWGVFASDDWAASHRARTEAP